jgi:hypothetical protein
MAKTKRTHPYSGSSRCSGRNQKLALPDETGGARKSRKKGVPKGQRKDSSELHACLNAQAEVVRKDQESLGRDSAAALEHHQQATIASYIALVQGSKFLHRIL